MGSMRNFFNNRGGIDKGSVYVVVIMIILIFAGYILVGGTLPTKIPKPNYNLVSLIMPPNQPAASSLQMHTFYGVIPTPKPIQPSINPTDSPYNPTFLDCGYNSIPQEAPMIWGYIIDSALKVFYTNKFALSLGSGTISQMTKHPTDHITNPNTGPGGPALFLTDITTAIADKSGDAESGGQLNSPSDVYGTWKASGAINPAENQRDLGPGADPWPPANGPAGKPFTNFTSEIIWRFPELTAIDPATKQYLALQPGHTYRGEIILNDGENPSRTQRMCITFKMP